MIDKPRGHYFLMNQSIDLKNVSTECHAGEKDGFLHLLPLWRWMLCQGGRLQGHLILLKGLVLLLFTVLQAVPLTPSVISISTCTGPWGPN